MQFILFRGKLFCFRWDIGKFLEADSRLEANYFFEMKWGHFLFGRLIWMSWTLILRLRQHS
jgi:hypothetical protein